MIHGPVVGVCECVCVCPSLTHVGMKPDDWKGQWFIKHMQGVEITHTHTQLQYTAESILNQLSQTHIKMAHRLTHMSEGMQAHIRSTGWSNWASGDSGQIQDTLGSLVKPK